MTNILNNKQQIMKSNAFDGKSKKIDPKMAELNHLVFKFIQSANSTKTPIDGTVRWASHIRGAILSGVSDICLSDGSGEEMEVLEESVPKSSQVLDCLEK